MVRLGLSEFLDVEFLDWDAFHVGQLCRALQLSPSLRRVAWGCSFGSVLPNFRETCLGEQLSTVILSCAVDSEELFTARLRCCWLEVLRADLLVRSPQPWNSAVLLLSLIGLRMGVAADIVSSFDGFTLKTLELRHGFSGPPPLGLGVNFNATVATLTAMKLSMFYFRAV